MDEIYRVHHPSSTSMYPSMWKLSEPLPLEVLYVATINQIIGHW
jgi:hypothetical protein